MRGVTTVDGDPLPSDVARPVRGEARDGLGNVARCAEATCGPTLQRSCGNEAYEANG